MCVYMVHKGKVLYVRDKYIYDVINGNTFLFSIPTGAKMSELNIEQAIIFTLEDQFPEVYFDPMDSCEYFLENEDILH